MAFDRRYRPWSPALIGNRKFVGAAEAEGRNQIEREGGGMVVKDDDGNVGLVFAIHSLDFSKPENTRFQ